MSGPPYFPVYPSNHLAGTEHLDCEEHGANFLLMLAAWSQDDCSLPDDDRKLARICRVRAGKWKALRPVLLELWISDNGRWFHPELLRHRAFLLRKSEQNTKSANIRWGKHDVEKKEDGECERISKRNASYIYTQTSTLEAKASNAGELDFLTAADLTKVIFDTGVNLLIEAETMRPEQARSIVGKWRKKFSDHVVLAVLSRCQVEKPTEPVEWMTKALQAEALKSGASHGQTHPDRSSLRDLGQRVAEDRQARFVHPPGNE